MQLMETFIEARAEELSASWLEQFAEPRPKKKEDVAEGRLPLPAVKKRRMPVWVKRAVEVGESRRYR